MAKRTYWKDIRLSFSQSKGRFLSIFSLMAIGAIALVGLKVTPPNMERTAQTYIDRYKTMDLTVMGSYGLDEDDVKELNTLDNATVEYGYLSDVTIKGSNDAIRIFSESQNISRYKLISGAIPQKANEIALESSMKSDYKIGDKISFKQSETGILKNTSFTVTGFVDSSEIWDEKTMGTSTAGSGQLTGYGVTTADAFDSDVYLIARIRYDDLKNLDYSSDEYMEKLNQHKEDLDDLLADNGKKRLAQLKKDGQADIDKGYVEIEKTEKSLAEAAQKIAATESQIASGQLPTQAASAALAQSKADYEKQKSQAESQIASSKSDLEAAQEKLDSLKTPTYNSYTRSSLPGGEGYTTYSAATGSISSVGNIFPVVLYLVAAMVTLTTMTRFVDEERNKAGIFKALGYTNRQILAKFVIYGLVASMLGTAVGILAGNIILSPVIGNIISGTSVIGASHLYFYPSWTLLTIFLGLISAVLPAYLVARKELTEEPAQLLLAKPPVSGSKILLERLTFIWKRLSFTHKVTARNIFRYKQRMLMTIFGVAGSVALLFAGLGIQSSISGIVDSQFGDILKYDMIVVENSGASQEDKKAVNNLLSSSQVSDKLAVQYLTTDQKISGVAENQTVSVLVSDSSDLANFIKLKNRTSGQSLKLTNSGAVISEKLAKLYKVQVGDNIKMTLDSKTVNVNISGISEMYAGHFVYMTATYYQELTGQAQAKNSYLVRLKNGSSKGIRKVAADFLALAGVAGVSQNTSLIKQVETVSSSLNSVMLILIVLSVLLAVVILYNLTNINVAERIRELSTIKVLGFHNKEVTLYIYRETISLSIIGIVLGLLGGYGLHQAILNIIGSDNIMFNPSVALYVYLVPVFAIVLILAILGWLVNHNLRKVDMLEALKSVE